MDWRGGGGAAGSWRRGEGMRIAFEMYRRMALMMTGVKDSLLDVSSAIEVVLGIWQKFFQDAIAADETSLSRS